MKQDKEMPLKQTTKITKGPYRNFPMVPARSIWSW